MIFFVVVPALGGLGASNLNLFLTLFVILFQDLLYSECVLGLDFGLSVYPRVNLGRLHNFLSLEEALIRVWELSRIGVREKSL